MKLILTLLFIPIISTYAKLNPFETDACTYFIDGSWSDCCVEHDIRYWMGGDEKQRDLSDLKLKECVAKKSNNFWSTIIYQGVRVGHLSPIKSKYEWSWGWSEKSERYSPLNWEQKVMAVDALRQSGLNKDLIEKIIKEHDLDAR